MNTSSQADSDGHAVGVGLLRFKPIVLALSAACLTALIFLFGWLVPAGRDRTSRERAATRNSATNQDVGSDRVDVVPAVADSADAVLRSAPTAAAAEKSLVFSDTRPAPAPSPTVATEGDGGYTVQAGSFYVVAEANECVNLLRSAGFEARVAAVVKEKRKTWYRVYSGRFTSHDEAKLHDKKVRASGLNGGTVIVPIQD